MTAPRPPRPATPSRLLSQECTRRQSARGFASRADGEDFYLTGLAVTNSVVRFLGVLPQRSVAALISAPFSCTRRYTGCGHAR